ncbi:hypothetical protein BSZ39_10440 [Bowdeniella nasicola]|uniref:Glycosyl hydrolase family 13 catalytic domain-containing protein n=1 Tax=Bowdeniella nasicola TaxID=208480 RepID=A0A1Q5Q076_9ACTO|nr:hypothetical protein BSZ39_10440 [Bowdeniella nasicola]
MRDAIFWHVYPLGALGAPDTQDGPEVVHRLPRLIDWLDHLVTIGCNGLLLGPIFASASHGYGTLDHFRIDPRLGDLDDFRELIAACTKRGIRVGLDGVFNHVGRDLELARDDATFFEGHTGLVELDYSDPAMADLVVEVMDYWSRQGVSCWRLDAAYAMDPAIWAPILERVRASHPDLYVFGEVIHGAYAGIVTRSGFDSVTQYELWKATWSALNDRNLFELDHALGRHAELLEAFVPQTFISNHDVTRIASRLADSRHLRHEVALLALLPGTPSIYYGDGDGFTGTKYEPLGGDAEIRPPLPAHPAELSELGRPVRALYQELIGFPRCHRFLHDAVITRSELTNETLALELTSRDGTGRGASCSRSTSAMSRPRSRGWTSRRTTSRTHHEDRARLRRRQRTRVSRPHSVSARRRHIPRRRGQGPCSRGGPHERARARADRFRSAGRPRRFARPVGLAPATAFARQCHRDAPARAARPHRGWRGRGRAGRVHRLAAQPVVRADDAGVRQLAAARRFASGEESDLAELGTDVGISCNVAASRPLPETIEADNRDVRSVRMDRTHFRRGERGWEGDWRSRRPSIYLSRI